MQPGSSEEGVMSENPEKEDDLFSGTQKPSSKYKKKQTNKNRGIPCTTLPDATGVYRCKYDHSQHSKLVVKHFAYVKRNVFVCK